MKVKKIRISLEIIMLRRMRIPVVMERMAMVTKMVMMMMVTMMMMVMVMVLMMMMMMTPVVEEGGDDGGLASEDHHDGEGHQEDLVECHHPGQPVREDFQKSKFFFRTCPSTTRDRAAQYRGKR